MNYDPLKIRKLELVAQRYYYGSQSFDGILNFITYRGDLPEYELDPNATELDYEGLQEQREFFSPVYETAPQASNRIPDFRNLLYWSPGIKPDENGKHQVNFYTSDLPGKYLVVLQGITPDGRTISERVNFTVEDK